MSWRSCPEIGRLKETVQSRQLLDPGLDVAIAGHHGSLGRDYGAIRRHVLRRTFVLVTRSSLLTRTRTRTPLYTILAVFVPWLAWSGRAPLGHPEVRTRPSLSPWTPRLIHELARKGSSPVSVSVLLLPHGRSIGLRPRLPHPVPPLLLQAKNVHLQAGPFCLVPSSLPGNRGSIRSLRAVRPSSLLRTVVRPGSRYSLRHPGARSDAKTYARP